MIKVSPSSSARPELSSTICHKPHVLVFEIIQAINSPFLSRGTINANTSMVRVCSGSCFPSSQRTAPPSLCLERSAAGKELSFSSISLINNWASSNTVDDKDTEMSRWFPLWRQFIVHLVSKEKNKSLFLWFYDRWRLVIGAYTHSPHLSRFLWQTQFRKQFMCMDQISDLQINPKGFFWEHTLPVLTVAGGGHFYSFFCNCDKNKNQAFQHVQDICYGFCFSWTLAD